MTTPAEPDDRAGHARQVFQRMKLGLAGEPQTGPGVKGLQRGPRDHFHLR